MTPLCRRVRLSSTCFDSLKVHQLPLSGYFIYKNSYKLNETTTRPNFLSLSFLPERDYVTFGSLLS